MKIVERARLMKFFSSSSSSWKAWAALESPRVAWRSSRLSHHSSVMQDSVNRNKLVRFANNFMAYREQHDSVQPAFTPPSRPVGEISRSQLMFVMTPLTQLPLGRGSMWRFNEFARGQPHQDNKPYTPKETEWNWALFRHRWPAILDAFQQGYRNPRALWDFPGVGSLPAPVQPLSRPRVA